MSNSAVTDFSTISAGPTWNFYTVTRASTCTEGHSKISYWRWLSSPHAVSSPKTPNFASLAPSTPLPRQPIVSQTPYLRKCHYRLCPSSAAAARHRAIQSSNQIALERDIIIVQREALSVVCRTTRQIDLMGNGLNQTHCLSFQMWLRARPKALRTETRPYLKLCEVFLRRTSDSTSVFYSQGLKVQGLLHSLARGKLLQFPVF